MKLKKLKLVNIRSHKDSELEINDGITVFTGRTGSGKSTLLMAVEYALFGSEAGIPNETIMRRHSASSRVYLRFEHKGNIYEISRGLKKSGTKVLVDTDSLCITKNGNEVDFVKRAGDMNEIIKSILGFPESLKPKELFETVAYAKQDEIRALIELKPEERQVYMDNILQLSKYQNTWTNMKTVIDFFERKAMSISGELSLLPRYAEELELFRKKIQESEQELDADSQQLEKISADFDAFKKQLTHKKEEFNKALAEKSIFDRHTAVADSLERELKQIKQFIDSSRFIEFSKNDAEKIEQLDSLIHQYANLLSESEHLSRELRQVQSEKSEISEKLKTGQSRCPLCRQELSSEHVRNLESEFSRKLSQISDKIREISCRLPELSKQINEIKELKKQFEKNTQQSGILQERKKTLSEKQALLESCRQKINLLAGNASLFSEIKSELDALNEQENLMISKKTRLETSINSLKQNLFFLRDSEAKKSQAISKLQLESKKLEKTSAMIKSLKTMRGDIRNIRDVVRLKFLEDFRQLFQAKFEEIRKEDSEYAVSITKEYEPVAYTTSGAEVPIGGLSGGEKTSVALAYRLAIADLAALLGGIQDSKMIILDEPTMGFDNEDISALPAVLRNLRNIPQIIIVTHESTLKDSADYKYRVHKLNSISKITHE